MFTVYPAIDLKDGNVVRLAEGDMDRATVYSDRPAQQAKAFTDAGASWLHVVDLDGAFAGSSRNAEEVEQIIATAPAKIQIGGGIRSMAAIDRWFRLGVERVIIGTAAMTDPGLVRAAANDYPGRIVVAVDARGGYVATHGWADVSDIPVADMGRRFEDAGVAALLFTDVGRDGLLQGINIAATAALASAVTLPVIASGGLASLADIATLKTKKGIEGVIAGRALYAGQITLEDALREAAKAAP